MKLEHVKSEDCFIDKIDYTKKSPDFRLVPFNVVKDELTRNGIRTTVKKSDVMALISVIWKYRKAGEIPLRYYFEEEDDS